MAHIKDVKIGNNTYLIEPTVYAATAGTASAITAAVNNFALGTGVVVTLKITTTNAANATLNVNSTGVKTLRYGNVNLAADVLKVNRFYSFVYDGTYWQLIGELDTNTNTWRGIQDNLTSSTNTTESLSAKQGYLLAHGSARDETKVLKKGDTMSGNLYIQASEAVVSVKSTSTNPHDPQELQLGSWPSGRQGLWSIGYQANPQWLIYRETTGDVIVNGSVNGNATTATGLVDAGDDTHTITIQYNNSGFSVPASNWLPMYDDSGNLVCVSAENLANKIQEKANGAWNITTAGSAVITVKDTFCGHALQLGSWHNGTQGLWSLGYYTGSKYEENGKWLIYRNTSGNVIVNGTASENVTKTGDTMTGNLNIQKSSSPQIVLTNTTTGISLYLGNWGTDVDSGIHGLWSTGYWAGSTLTTSGKYMIYRNNSGNVIVNGSATGLIDAGKSDHIITIKYYNSGTNVAATDWLPMYYGNGDLICVSSSNLASKLANELPTPNSGQWWPDSSASKLVPKIKDDGVMEIGRYIDFHTTKNTQTDYDIRFDAKDADTLLITKYNSGNPLKATLDAYIPAANITGTLSVDHGGTGGTLPIGYGGTGATEKYAACRNLMATSYLSLTTSTAGTRSTLKDQLTNLLIGYSATFYAQSDVISLMSNGKLSDGIYGIIARTAANKWRIFAFLAGSMYTWGIEGIDITADTTTITNLYKYTTSTTL